MIQVKYDAVPSSDGRFYVTIFSDNPLVVSDRTPAAFRSTQSYATQGAAERTANAMLQDIKGTH